LPSYYFLPFLICGFQEASATRFFRTSIWVLNPIHFLGLILLKSVPFSKYLRTNPFISSIRPFFNRDRVRKNTVLFQVFYWVCSKLNWNSCMHQ